MREFSKVFPAGMLRFFGLALMLLLGSSGCASDVGDEGEDLGSVSEATTAGVCSTPPAANECRYSPFSASASSVEASGTAYQASNAIDGSCTSRWSSASSDPQWLKVDLGSSRPLSRVIIHWEAAASSAYELQASPDGTTWTKIATKANATITGSGSTRVDTIAGLTASARYLRLYSTARTTSYGNSIFELEVFGTGCGPAPGCSQIPVFPASAASSSNQSSDKGPEKAIDGLSSTRWSSAASDPQWLRLDLGTSQKVSRVVLDWEAASSARYEVQVSDSTSGPWTVIGVHTDSRTGPRTDDVGGLQGTGRYLRIYSTKRATTFGNSLFEVRVFRESCNACEKTLTPSAVTASSTESSAYPAAKAVDGDYGTRWSSAFSDPQWLRLDFGQEKRVKTVIIKWEVSASSKSYRLEGAASANGPWTTLATRTNLPAGARTDTLENINKVARYLRVYSTARNGNYGNSIYEIIVVGGPSSTFCADAEKDDDGDGVVNGEEEVGCRFDPAKTTPGIAGCGVSEADPDGDGIPSAVDDCDDSPLSAYKGQCGCPPSTARNGKPCSDSVIPGIFTCNNGICGNPTTPESLPQAGCFIKTLGWRAYWFCPAATVAQATTRCANVKGRRLIQIDNRQENAFAAKFITGESWIGAVDRTTEGEWSWLSAAGAEKKKFWTGGGGGKPFKGLFQSWLSGNPGSDSAKDCGTISSDLTWRAQACSESRPYICERPFGPGFIPGSPLPGTRPSLGPEDIIPYYPLSSNDDEDDDGDGGGDGNGDLGPNPPDCVDDLSDADVAAQDAQLQLCEQHCGEDANPKATPEQCEGYCTGAAKVPPADKTCTGNGEPMSPVLLAENSPSCTVEDTNCHGFTMGGIFHFPTRCGVQTTCYDVSLNQTTGVWAARTCDQGCIDGAKNCDTSTGKCINPGLHNACGKPDTDPSAIGATQSQDGVCHGECFGKLGCGLPTSGFTMQDAANPRCDETVMCTPELTEGLTEGSTLLAEEPWTDEVLPDFTAAPAPDYTSDFDTPCTQEPCKICLGDSANDPYCKRTERHNWCTYEDSAVGDPAANVNDQKDGGRGSDSSIIKFDIDPGADLNFDVKPLAFGVSDFKVQASASVRTTASFDIKGIGGTIEIVDLRAALTASLCHASTKDSHIEVLGIDFLPKLASAAGVGKVIFNTDDDWSGAQACKDAVFTYVDAVDRAKKALRDAQELVNQFNALKVGGHTFAHDFCETFAGPDMRPEGMEGSCGAETPADTVNQFINYYSKQATAIGPALKALQERALSSGVLGDALGFGAGDGQAFFAQIGGQEGGLGGKESVTLLNLNFFIGPVPCNLEVATYLNYGIKGGLGAQLQPAALVSGGGPFAKAIAHVTPFADAGVTLFVGVGFSAGPFSLKLGIEGKVTLANINLDATAEAGLSLTTEADDRPLPNDLKDLTNHVVIFPSKGGLQKYNFQFDYAYGVNFAALNMLDGNIDAALKIKFFFFSKKWSKRLVAIHSGLQIGPINLIGGGSFDQGTKNHETPVPEDTKTWKSSYSSVPFVGLEPVFMPQTPVVVYDGEFDTDRAGELFYDSKCKCEQNGEGCFRDGDCCDPAATCMADPAQGNKKVCRNCGAHTACSTAADCCGSNTICSQQPYRVCTFGNDICFMVAPQTPVCQRGSN